MRIATKMSEDEYDSQITPVIIRLFSSPDRAMRVCLLGYYLNFLLLRPVVPPRRFPFS